MGEEAMNKSSRFKIVLGLVVTGAATLYPPPAALAQKPEPARPIPHDEGKNTVGEISEEVARVRLQKLGYTNVQQLTRNGAFWEATASKGNQRVQIRLHAQTGARTETPAAPLQPNR
jgi:hypothetical protein